MVAACAFAHGLDSVLVAGSNGLSWFLSHEKGLFSGVTQTEFPILFPHEDAMFSIKLKKSGA